VLYVHIAPLLASLSFACYLLGLAAFGVHFVPATTLPALHQLVSPGPSGTAFDTVVATQLFT
jgi:hypothetical protein